MDDISTDVKKLKSIDNLPSSAMAIFVQLEEKLQSYSLPFSGVNTEYLHSKYLLELGLLIEPRQFVTGRVGESLTLNSRSSHYVPGVSNSYGQFVSIKELIIAISQHTDLLNGSLTGHPGRLASFYDGLHWRQHELRDHEVIVLRLYGDDIEPANALGARKTVYKVGCIYFTFEHLDNVELSKLENYFLALTYYSEDVKSFGWEAVMIDL